MTSIPSNHSPSNTASSTGESIGGSPQFAGIAANVNGAAQMVIRGTPQNSASISARRVTSLSSEEYNLCKPSKSGAFRDPVPLSDEERTLLIEKYDKFKAKLKELGHLPPDAIKIAFTSGDAIISYTTPPPEGSSQTPERIKVNLLKSLKQDSDLEKALIDYTKEQIKVYKNHKIECNLDVAPWRSYVPAPKGDFLGAVLIEPNSSNPYPFHLIFQHKDLKSAIEYAQKLISKKKEEKTRVDERVEKADKIIKSLNKTVFERLKLIKKSPNNPVDRQSFGCLELINADLMKIDPFALAVGFQTYPFDEDLKNINQAEVQSKQEVIRNRLKQAYDAKCKEHKKYNKDNAWFIYFKIRSEKNEKRHDISNYLKAITDSFDIFKNPNSMTASLLKFVLLNEKDEHPVDHSKCFESYLSRLNEGDRQAISGALSGALKP
ncbi:MAG: hypothetical protein EBZ47_00140 [Chlamydiae bacterium]|nr:hypothetical protein [Chlamydiota bacterium]